MEESIERLGELIDKIGYLEVSLSMKIPDSIHVTAMREVLPEISQELKEIVTEIKG